MIEVHSSSLQERPPVPGQVVLVLQGGGALGAYQAGAYQALHESGIEPDWVIGTSIGAINGALIAGNPVATRVERLQEFWQCVTPKHALEAAIWPGFGRLFSNLSIIAGGVSGFFSPRIPEWQGVHASSGVDRASYYSTEALAETLSSMVDCGLLNSGQPRLTVGAVNVRSGAMRYFDSRAETLSIDHIRASGALPPAFPAIRIDGVPYWDGGIYSNTPIEAVLDDRPRRDSLIFAMHVWQPDGTEPSSIWEVMGRQKDIQYASRSASHLLRQRQIHRLRHVIRELCKEMSPEQLQRRDIGELAAYGCGTTMHVVHLQALRLETDDHTKDIDFTAGGIQARWQAGYADTQRSLERRAWLDGNDPIEGVVEH